MATEGNIRRQQPTVKRRVYRALVVVLVAILPLGAAFGNALVRSDPSGDDDMEGAGIFVLAFIGFLLWLTCLAISEIVLWVRRVSSTHS